MTTAPFDKPLRAISPCWIVRQVGTAVEIVCVGVIDVNDLRSTVERLRLRFVSLAVAAMATKPPKPGATVGNAIDIANASVSEIASSPPDVVRGIRLEDADAEDIWRKALALFHDIDDTAAHAGILLLTINQPQYLRIAKAIEGKK